MIYILRNCRFPSICLLLFSTCCVVSAQAQNPAVAYEDGVNAYFAGQTDRAEAFLSQAIELNSQDPRAYYFRALSLIRLGRCDLARGDMLTGATLEAQQPNRYAIGSALERIQGPNRLLLEDFRCQARLNAVAASSVPAAAGSPTPNRTFREGEENVVREKQFVPLEELLRPEGPRAIAVESPAEPATRPAVPPQTGSPAPLPATPPATPPAVPPQEKDPFADDSSRPAAPVATPPTPPQPAPQPASPPPAEEENPFGG